MKNLFTKLKVLTRATLHLGYCRSKVLARTACAVGLPVGAVRTSASGQYAFTQLGVSVPGRFAAVMIQGHHRLLDLRRLFPDTFCLDFSGKYPRLSARGITLQIQTWGDVDVMHEMLVRELYHFNLGRPCVVWDVGMNVGMASLFFAAMPDVVAVHGYELFKPTWELAQANFSLNPNMASKITSHACGLGANDAALELPYHEELKGVVGFDGPLLDSNGLQMRTEKVRVISAPLALDQIRVRHPSVPIVLKMDCEGAEGDILDSLAAAGRLNLIPLALLEWHGTPMRHRLESLFSMHGFVTASQPFSGMDVGAMTAVRAARS